MIKPIQRIDSWKNIFAYLNRDVTTCMKWAQHYDLPVYRIDEKSKRSRIFAFKSEIDDWFISKAKKAKKTKKAGKIDIR